MIPQEKIDELKAKHGDRIYVLENFDVAFRPPLRKEWRAIKLDNADPAKAPFVNEKLASLVVVYPDPAAFDALCDEFAALPDLVANAASAAAQNAASAAAKKA